MTLSTLINKLAQIQAAHGPEVEVHLQHADESGRFTLFLEHVRLETTPEPKVVLS